MKINVANFKTSTTDFSVILLNSNSELTSTKLAELDAKLPSTIQRPIVLAAQTISSLAFYGQKDLVDLVDETRFNQFPWHVVDV